MSQYKPLDSFLGEIQATDFYPNEQPLLQTAQQKQQQSVAGDGTSFGDALKDIGIGVSSGFTGTLQSILGLGSLVGFDPNKGAYGWAYKGLGDITSKLQQHYSPEAKQAKEAVYSAWDNTQGGYTDKALATLKAVADNSTYAPVALSEAVGSLLGIGGLARLLSKAAPMSPLAGAATTAGLVSAGEVAGKIASENPDNYSARLLAVPAGFISGAATAGLHKLGGRFDVDTYIMAKAFGYKVPSSAIANATGKGALLAVGKGVAKGSLAEGAEEAIQSAAEAAFANLGTKGTLDVSNVLHSGVLGGITGTLAGGAFGGVRAVNDIRDQKVQLTQLENLEPRTSRNLEETTPPSVVQEEPQQASQVQPARTINDVRNVLTNLPDNVSFIDNLYTIKNTLGTSGITDTISTVTQLALRGDQTLNDAVVNLLSKTLNVDNATARKILQGDDATIDEEYRRLASEYFSAKEMFAHNALAQDAPDIGRIITENLIKLQVLQTAANTAKDFANAANGDVRAAFSLALNSVPQNTPPLDKLLLTAQTAGSDGSLQSSVRLIAQLALDSDTTVANKAKRLLADAFNLDAATLERVFEGNQDTIDNISVRLETAFNSLANDVARKQLVGSVDSETLKQLQDAASRMQMFSMLVDAVNEARPAQGTQPVEQTQQVETAAQQPETTVEARTEQLPQIEQAPQAKQLSEVTQPVQAPEETPAQTAADVYNALSKLPKNATVLEKLNSVRDVLGAAGITNTASVLGQLVLRGDPKFEGIALKLLADTLGTDTATVNKILQNDTITAQKEHRRLMDEYLAAKQELMNGSTTDTAPVADSVIRLQVLDALSKVANEFSIAKSGDRGSAFSLMLRLTPNTLPPIDRMVVAAQAAGADGTLQDAMEVAVNLALQKSTDIAIKTKQLLADVFGIDVNTLEAVLENNQEAINAVLQKLQSELKAAADSVAKNNLINVADNAATAKLQQATNRLQAFNTLVSVVAQKEAQAAQAALNAKRDALLQLAQKVATLPPDKPWTMAQIDAAIGADVRKATFPKRSAQRIQQTLLHLLKQNKAAEAQPQAESQAALPQVEQQIAAQQTEPQVAAPQTVQQTAQPQQDIEFQLAQKVASLPLNKPWTMAQIDEAIGSDVRKKMFPKQSASRVEKTLKLWVQRYNLTGGTPPKVLREAAEMRASQEGSLKSSNQADIEPFDVLLSKLSDPVVLQSPIETERTLRQLYVYYADKDFVADKDTIDTIVRALWQANKYSDWMRITDKYDEVVANAEDKDAAIREFLRFAKGRNVKRVIDRDIVFDSAQKFLLSLAQPHVKVTLVENLNDPSLPPSIAAALAKHNAKAVFDIRTNRVYVNLAQHTSYEDVLETLYHEVVGHYGVRALLGSSLNATLDSIYKHRSADIDAVAARLNLDVNNIEQRREATEEFIAEFAQRLVNEKWFKPFITHLSSWARKAMGIRYSDDQIISKLLYPARGFTITKHKAWREALDTHPVDEPSVLTPVEAKTNLRAGAREIAVKLGSSLTFTPTLLRKLAKYAPAARTFSQVWNEQAQLAALWEVRQQKLGTLYANLSPTSRDAVSRALLSYSSTGALPHVPKNARLAKVERDGFKWTIKWEPLDTENLVIDKTFLRALSPQEKEAVFETIDTMADIRMADTELQMVLISNTINYLRMGSRVESEELDKLEYQALTALANTHNEQIRRGYVPQFRRGVIRIEAKSPDFVAQEGLRPETIGELRKDNNHYAYIGAESVAEAEAIAQQFREKGWTVRYWKELSQFEQGPVTIQQLTELYRELERDVANAPKGAEMLTEKAKSNLLHLLARYSDEMSTAVRAHMHRQNIAGVKLADVLPNVLDRVRDFGFYYGASRTASQRFGAIRQMREQINRLSDQDQATAATLFNELIERMERDADYDRGGLDAVAKHVQGFSAVYYLLTNPSYYALQLAQPWLMSLPVLQGEFGIAKAATVLASRYTEIKDVYKQMLKGEAELDFSWASEQHAQLLKELQARNRLDVGLSQEFGSLRGSAARNAATQALRKLYNAARSVEIINRATTALAAYDLKMEQLLRGRELSSLSKWTQDKFIQIAIDYADYIVQHTHGDYSFAAAPKVFKSPIGRVVLQFKKIALVQAELLYELASRSWRKPTLTDFAKDTLRSYEKHIPKDIFKKLMQEEQLNETELHAVHDALRLELQVLPEHDRALLSQVLGSELAFDNYVTVEQAHAAKKSFAYLLGTTAMVGGVTALPFVTTVLALAAKMAAGDDEPPEANAEAIIMKVFGPELGKFLLGGAAMSVLDIDISSRVGMNFVDQVFGAFYNNFRLTDPATSTKDAIVEFLGPSVSIAVNAMKAASYFNEYAETGSDFALMKGFTAMAPLGLKNLIVARMLDQEGLVSDSRLTLIPRDKLSDYDILKKALGFQPGTLSQYYSQREYVNKLKSSITLRRQQLKHAYYEAMLRKDRESLSELREKLKELREIERSIGIPPTTMSDVYQYIRKKRREQMRMIDGFSGSRAERGYAMQVQDIWGGEGLALNE